MIRIIMLFSVFNMLTFFFSKIFFEHYPKYKEKLYNNKISQTIIKKSVSPFVFCIPFGAFVLSLLFSMEDNWQNGLLRILGYTIILSAVFYLNWFLINFYFGEASY